MASSRRRFMQAGSSMAFLLVGTTSGVSAQSEVEISHNPASATRAMDTDEGKLFSEQLDIFVNTDSAIQFGGDVDRRLRVVETGSGQSVTYTPDPEARTIGLDELDRLGIQNMATGEPLNQINQFPDSASDIDYQNVNATVEGDTSIYTDDTFGRYRIELLDEDGSVMASTEDRLVAMGYEASFEQDGVTASVTRNPAVAEDWYAAFWLVGDDQSKPASQQIIAETEAQHNPENAIFEIDLSSLDVEPGEYTWNLVLAEAEDTTPDRERIIRMFGFEAVDIQEWDLTNKDDSQSAAVEDDDSEQQPDQESGSDSVPGFGIPGTLAGFGSAGYMIKRRLSAGRSED